MTDLRAEWTKFRTVRGWTIGTLVAIVLMVLMSVSTAQQGADCVNGKCTSGPSDPVGPGGQPVFDDFYFVHQTLDGDGSITVRISGLTDTLQQNVPNEAAPAAGSAETWGKAGIIVKASQSGGSAYAAVLASSGHGVRMQYDYTNDLAGSPAAVTAADPRWLRLTRSGDELTGYDSSDGVNWTEIGRTRLAGLGTSVQAGLFATSPQFSQNTQILGGMESSSYNSTATAEFDHVTLGGNWPDGTWTGSRMGGGSGQYSASGTGTDAAGFTVSGSGDIAPDPNLMDTSSHSVAGAIIGLIVLSVLAALFITSEYRYRMVATSLIAQPRRWRVLTAKTVVVGGTAAVSGLIAAAVSIPVYDRLWRAGALYPVTALTEARVVLGTALLLALCAVFALAVGTLVRRSAVAIATVIVLIILPYLLSIGSLLPAGAADWLLRVTPAAAFAVQQTIPVYPQVDNTYVPAMGYFPLAPWAGMAVLAGYTAVALALAFRALRRRDVSA